MCATADCFSESDHTEENQMESFPPDNNIKNIFAGQRNRNNVIIIRISLNHRLHDTNI